MDPIESSGLDKVLKEGKISNKMQSAITMAEEIVNQGEKVVIWSNFRNPMSYWKSNFSIWGSDFIWRY